jgi:hypothetical protein
MGEPRNLLLPRDAPRPHSMADGTWGRRLALAAAIVLALLLLAGAAYLVRHALGADRFTIEMTRPVLSRVDGLRYRVHEGHGAPQQAADLLATLNARVVDLMRHLRARYLRGPAGLLHPARRAAVRRLLARWNPDNLAENSPADPAGDTAFSIDKGSIVAICLRERTAEARLHGPDTLFFVTLHEMAHIAIEEVDHPRAFWAAFRFLLEEAEAAGLYVSPDFAAQPRRYCGVNIDYNPRWDPNTPPI